MMLLREALEYGSEQLKNSSDTANIDCEALLLHAINKDRTFLFSHPEYKLNEQENTLFKDSIQRRAKGEPVAYITGHKEFWSLDFIVTPDVLIPRPETEHIIEWILENYKNDENLLCADLGAGSGAIAVTLAHEKPGWQVHATDISANALGVARTNAERYQLDNVTFFHGSWCDALPENNYDIIAANPPYICADDPHLQQLQFEPQSALASGADGLDDIRMISEQAVNRLKPGGLLIIEHGYDQRDTIIKLLTEFGYQNIADHDDLAGQPRFVTAYR